MGRPFRVRKHNERGIDWIVVKKQRENKDVVNIRVLNDKMIVFCQKKMLDRGTHCGISMPENGEVFISVGERNDINVFPLVQTGRGACLFSVGGHNKIFKDWGGKYELKNDGESFYISKRSMINK